MRRDPDFFGDRELDLVYIAKKLQEALRLESIFTESGVDYAVEPDQYSGGVIFRSERVGAFFYVLSEAAEQARVVLREHGFRFLSGGGE
jgi:vacuolar-type H+-ATPase subunit E/Vma4